jgi:hypothetical protein
MMTSRSKLCAMAVMAAMTDALLRLLVMASMKSCPILSPEELLEVGREELLAEHGLEDPVFLVPVIDGLRDGPSDIVDDLVDVAGRKPRRALQDAFVLFRPARERLEVTDRDPALLVRELADLGRPSVFFFHVLHGSNFSGSPGKKRSYANEASLIKLEVPGWTFPRDLR